MRHQPPGARAPESRRWYLRAYGRAVGAVLLALSVLFAVFLAVGPDPLWPNPDGSPSAIAARYGFAVVGRPYLPQFVDFLASRLTSPLVAGPLLAAGTVTLALVARERRT
ncbi:hypothetical protein [Halosimplex halobium]|uniref:hypothetical protein n=1 Tax=Halosimplex halobium TaxID=3396618 RepID=UPI003F5641DF